MVCALGLTDHLVGVSPDCDYPPEVKTKPVVLKNALDLSELSSRGLDRHVSDRLHKGEKLLRVDGRRLNELRPDVVIARAATDGEIPPVSKTLYLAPRTLEDIFENFRTVGNTTGTLDKAKDIVYDLRLRAMAAQCNAYRDKQIPRVAVLHWMDPPYLAGLWVPEMIEIAGGKPGPASAGKDSLPMTWDQLAEFNPDVVVCAPCGHHLAGAMKEAALLAKCPFPGKIGAFRDNRLYVVDGDAYINRPGPRVVDGIELLAHLLHPEFCTWSGPAAAFQKIAL